VQTTTAKANELIKRDYFVVRNNTRRKIVQVTANEATSQL